MTRIIITGGSGFIGTNLLDSLHNDGYSILNIDLKEPLDKKHLSLWKQINILDYLPLEAAILNFDPEIIIHLAAVTDLNGNTLSYYDANILGTQNIIKIAAKAVSLKKVLYTSSMYVCQPGFIPQDFDSYKPHTVYGESKVEGELLVKKIKNVKYEWVIIRPTSIWGPWFNIPYIDFFNVVYQAKYFDFGKACTKTYGYVENTVFQIRSLMDANTVNGKTFYLGDLPPIPITEWANEISMEIHKKPIRKIPIFLVQVAAKIGDVLSVIKVKFPITSFRLSNMTTDNILPLENLYEITGSPPITRNDGVKKTLEWLKKNKAYRY